MTDDSVALAASRYEQGKSLAFVANEFGPDARTLAREFRRAGTSIRSRRGWRLAVQAAAARAARPLVRRPAAARRVVSRSG